MQSNPTALTLLVQVQNSVELRRRQIFPYVQINDAVQTSCKNLSQVSESPRSVVDSTMRMSTWLKELVESFRSQYSLMTESERRFVNLDDFTSPCQIDMFWFQPPDVQYLMVTHFEDRPDLEINVNGPYPTYDAVDKLESILEESRWNHPIPKGETRFLVMEESGVFRDVVEQCFLEIVRGFRQLPFLRPVEQANPGFKSLLAPKAFIWYLVGDVSRSMAADLALEIVEQAKDQAKASTISQPFVPSEPKPVIQAHGGFIFPPVWIGSKPKPSFREKALGGRPMFPAKVYDGTYKGKLVVADKDGFVAIEEDDRVKATGLLNEIMAVRLLQGKSTFSFREQEVQPATIDPATKEIQSFGVPSFSLRASLMDERWSQPHSPSFDRDIISLVQFQELIRNADVMARDFETADSLRSILEAYTHLEDSRYLESFVLSWLIVEKYLYTKWKEFLKSEGVHRGRREKLTNSANWSIDYVIEGLTLVKQLSLNEYTELMSMKSLRNDIVHEGERVSKEQAMQAFEAASEIVSQKVGASATEPQS